MKKYVPIIKTRDSELKALKKLDHSTLREILPCFELTKSRKTKKALQGDITKRMEQILEIMNGEDFLLDVTTSEKYSNPQTERLLDPEEGFSAWYTFIFEHYYSSTNIVPIIHVDPGMDGKFEDTLSFVTKASKLRNLAIRVPFEIFRDSNSYEVLNIISEKCDRKIHYIIDFEHLDEIENFYKEATKSHIKDIFTHIQSLKAFGSVSIASSSFPLNVKDSGKKNGYSDCDELGTVHCFEFDLYELIKSIVPDLIFGDYATINIQQVEIRGGTFVPRIDIFFGEKPNNFFYYRYRRDDGSYTKCAINVKADSRYEAAPCWGCDQINAAASGKPNGKSPSFWITVRMNYYIQMLVSKWL